MSNINTRNFFVVFRANAVTIQESGNAVPLKNIVHNFHVLRRNRCYDASKRFLDRLKLAFLTKSSSRCPEMTRTKTAFSERGEMKEAEGDPGTGKTFEKKRLSWNERKHGKEASIVLRTLLVFLYLWKRRSMLSCYTLGRFRNSTWMFRRETVRLHFSVVSQPERVRINNRFDWKLSLFPVRTLNGRLHLL